MHHEACALYICRAVLLGEKTFGKGVVQYFFPMSDSSGVKVTVAKYITPNGYDITRAGGLAPDVTCHDFRHAGEPSGASDTCLKAALQALQSASITQDLTG